MPRLLLSAHMPLYRAVEFDYPFREVVRSVLPVVDEFYLVVHPGEDGTLEAAEALASECSAVKVHVHPWWDFDRGHESLADATNYGIEQCRGEWHLALQADEVVHEDQLETLLSLCRQDTHPWVWFERLNFYGSFDCVNRRRDRWPCDVVRLARRDLYPHICSYGDATHLGIPKNYHPQETPRLDARDRLALWHYCYTRPGRAFVDRQANMAKLYGLGPDPRIEANREKQQVDWWGYLPREEMEPLSSPHPAVMTEWIAQRRAAVEAGAWEL